MTLAEPGASATKVRQRARACWVNVLIVGAGAVGQVFAWYLTQGGASLTFFVKPHHEVPSELPMLLEVKRPVVLTGYRVLKHLDDVVRQQWDQVWLAVPSNTLSQEWLPKILAATGSSTVLTMAVEGEEHIPQARRVVAGFPLIAWPDPLPGHSGPSRLVLYVPPMARVPVSGEDAARVEAVMQALEKGGCKTSRVPNASELGKPLTALLISSVAAIEAAGWKLRDFKGQWSALAAACAREVLVADGGGLLPRLLARGVILRFAFWFASKWLPFDLEAYTKFHFTKVGEQTRVLFALWEERGKANGVSTRAIEALRRAIGPSK